MPSEHGKPTGVPAHPTQVLSHDPAWCCPDHVLCHNYSQIPGEVCTFKDWKKAKKKALLSVTLYGNSAILQKYVPVTYFQFPTADTPYGLIAWVRLAYSEYIRLSGSGVFSSSSRATPRAEYQGLVAIRLPSSHLAKPRTTIDHLAENQGVNRCFA